ncbi:hypothetical protein [Neosynechococcus sphagnicola]|uniref:hypothetical protein n=1 Tax=Neosynechococcus sphagnicola TaxID=1501145 RepID=UPI00068F93B2|nr:hypothetical protein [Neosynechococcus sphagnicola]
MTSYFCDRLRPTFEHRRRGCRLKPWGKEPRFPVPPSRPNNCRSCNPIPFPPSLAQWRNDGGDYWDQLVTPEVGALVWSEFPIQVYVEPPGKQPSETAWTQAVLAAVQEWQPYLPLVVVDQSESADIAIWRRSPPLRLAPRPSPSVAPVIERVRSAETRYALYLQQGSGSASVLIHRCVIYLSPKQTAFYVRAAARHELGHALGIWGHSPQETDTMYFAQVRNPPTISQRDVNTLKRVYEQPTRLGWPLRNGN